MSPSLIELECVYLLQGPFDVEKLKVEELRDGTAKTSWVPEVTHPAIPQESRVALASSLLAGVLLSMSSGDFRVSDEWNQLLSDYSFIKPDEFLTNAWEAIGEGAKVINLD